MSTIRFILGLAILCLAGLGCSDSGAGGQRVPTHPVTGKVTMNGGPLAGAMIAFAPTEGQPTAIGRSNDAGEYSLTTYDANDGAAKGAFNVTVMKVVAAAGATPADAGHGTNYQGVAHGGKAAKGATSDAGNLVPPQYSNSEKTPLKFTVEEKANTYDIEIK